MKIERHAIALRMYCTMFFLDSLQAFADNFALTDKNLKKIQFYSDFFLPDGTYPFMDEDTIYYPATLIYKANHWKVQWIYWNKSDIDINRSPFHCDKPIQISSCNTVPRAFQNMIAGKTLLYVKKPHHAVGEIGPERRPRGELNINFLDEVSRQISEQLIALTKCSLSKWGIEIAMDAGILKIDDINYMVAELKNQHADGICVGFCWTGSAKPCDFVVNQNITFSLTDIKFHRRVSSISKVVEFIKNNGFSGKGFSFSYPEVEMVCKLKTKVTHEIKDNIFSSVMDFISNWNNNETGEEKIHDCFWLESDDHVLILYIDFGNCSPDILFALLKHLDTQALPGLKEISLR